METDAVDFLLLLRVHATPRCYFVSFLFFFFRDPQLTRLAKIIRNSRDGTLDIVRLDVRCIVFCKE
jgi:hypothetical protein